MPPLRPVSSLQKLCTTTIASHFLDVFSSWYTAAQKDIIPSQSEEEYNSSLGHRDIYTLKGEFALDNCYSCDICTNVDVCDHDNVKKNKVLLNLLTEGVSSLQTADKTDKNDVRNTTGQGVPSLQTADVTDKNDSTDQDDVRNITGLVPVPIHHETETPTTVWLTNQMKHYINSNIFWPAIQDILSTLLDLIAQRVDIPRPTEKTRCYDEDVHFINFLSFLLRVSVTSFLSKTVNTLDFSSVSHLVYHWKLLCRKSVTLKDGRKVDSPYFDIFGYALDITLPELRTLKYLKVPHFVHDNLVHKVAFLCPSLETLILRCSSDCTTHKLIYRCSPDCIAHDFILKNILPSIKGLNLLSGYGCLYKCQDGTELRLRGCRNLVTLRLPNYSQTGIINSSIFEMLSNMQDLRCLDGASMISIDKYVQQCNYIRSPKLTNFDQQKLWTDRYTMYSDILPHVGEFWIIPEDGDIIKVLKCFDNENKVTMHNNFGIEHKSVAEYLKNFTSLNMADQDDLLNRLRDSCPNLEELTLESYTMPKLEYNSGERSTFPCLHTLKFNSVCELDGDDLLAVLSVCPGLLYFELVTVFNDHFSGCIDTATFQRALPYFEKLNKFVYWVGGLVWETVCDTAIYDFPHTLTMDSLKSLIAFCPDLKYVGQLNSWDVTSEEITALKEEAKTSNWDLEIVW